MAFWMSRSTLLEKFNERVNVIPDYSLVDFLDWFLQGGYPAHASAMEELFSTLFNPRIVCAIKLELAHHFNLSLDLATLSAMSGPENIEYTRNILPKAQFHAVNAALALFTKYLELSEAFNDGDKKLELESVYGNEKRKDLWPTDPGPEVSTITSIMTCYVTVTKLTQGFRHNSYKEERMEMNMQLEYGRVIHILVSKFGCGILLCLSANQSWQAVVSGVNSSALEAQLDLSFCDEQSEECRVIFSPLVEAVHAIQEGRVVNEWTFQAEWTWDRHPDLSMKEALEPLHFG